MARNSKKEKEAQEDQVITEPMLIKLITGELLLVSKMDIKEQYTIMHDPYLVIRAPRKDTSYGSHFGLESWIPYTKHASFPIDSRHIITYNVPDEELAMFYKEVIFSSDTEQYPAATDQIH